jgi:Protein of unknown function (DUF1682)
MKGLVYINMSLVWILSRPLVSGKYVEEDTDFYYSLEDNDIPLEIPVQVQPIALSQNLYFETVALLFLAIFFFNYYIGKKKNEKIATEWMYLIKPLFQENFSHTGVAEKEGDGEML